MRRHHGRRVAEALGGERRRGAARERQRHSRHRARRRAARTANAGAGCCAGRGGGAGGRGGGGDGGGGGGSGRRGPGALAGAEQTAEDAARGLAGGDEGLLCGRGVDGQMGHERGGEGRAEGPRGEAREPHPVSVGQRQLAGGARGGARHGGPVLPGGHEGRAHGGRVTARERTAQSRLGVCQRGHQRGKLLQLHGLARAQKRQREERVQRGKPEACAQGQLDHARARARGDGLGWSS